MAESDTEADKQIAKLQAEVHIVRLQVKKLEKDNAKLLKEKSAYFLNKYEGEKEYKRRLNMFNKEFLIKDAQSQAVSQANSIDDRTIPDCVSTESQMSGHADTSSSYKCSNREPTAANTDLNIRYALKQSINLNKAVSQGEIEKLRFFRDYFFDDFYSLDTDTVLEAIGNAQLTQAGFIDMFELFCCKKQVFNRFCARALEMTGFFTRQVVLLQNTPAEWICECLDTLVDDTELADRHCSKETEAHQRSKSVRTFIRTNIMYLLDLLSGIADIQPTVLTCVLSQEKFDMILAQETAEARRFVSTVCKQGGVGYINETNIDRLCPHNLTLCFGDQYTKCG